MSKRSKRIKRRTTQAAGLKTAKAAGTIAFTRAQFAGMGVHAAR